MRRCSAPALEPNRALLGLEALTGVHPFALARQLLDHALDVLGQAQLEQISKPPRLGLAHDPLVAEAAVAAQQRRPQVARQSVDERPKARRAVFGRVLVAGTDVDIENQTRRSHRIGVIAMARTSGFLRIVAQRRSFLMAVERLDCRIDVEDPGLGKQRLHAKREMTAQPGRAFRLIDRLEGASDRILADDFLHAQQLWQHSVETQRRDMGVALVSGEHGQHRRAENVALVGRVRAHVAQRTVRYESIKQIRSSSENE